MSDHTTDEDLAKTIPDNKDYDYYRMKADQHYELAGLARQDNDMKDPERNLKLARLYNKKASGMRY